MSAVSPVDLRSSEPNPAGTRELGSIGAGEPGLCGGAGEFGASVRSPGVR